MPLGDVCCAAIPPPMGTALPLLRTVSAYCLKIAHQARWVILQQTYVRIGAQNRKAPLRMK